MNIYYNPAISSVHLILDTSKHIFRVWQFHFSSVYIFFGCMYIMWSEQFKLEKVLTMIGSIMVIDMLTHSALLHFVCDLIWKPHRWTCNTDLMLYKFKLDHNTIEATKNICSGKSGGTIDPNGSRNFSQVSRTLTISQGLVGLKV